MAIIPVVKMPRSSREAHRALGRLPKAIAEGGLTAAAHRVVAQGKPVLPRLWNAKRRIKTGRILDPERTLKENGRRVPGNVALNVVLQDRDSQAWKRLVSEDVVKFIEDAKLPPEARNNCLANPTAFFAYPNNVPEALRKQVYLYERIPCFLCSVADTFKVRNFQSLSHDPLLCRPNTLHLASLCGSTSSI